MGRTFRREKSNKHQAPRLNNHRDLPDYDNLRDEDDPDYPEEDEYYGRQIRAKKQDVGRHENEPSHKKD